MAHLRRLVSAHRPFGKAQAAGHRRQGTGGRANGTRREERGSRAPPRSARGHDVEVRHVDGRHEGGDAEDGAGAVLGEAVPRVGLAGSREARVQIGAYRALLLLPVPEALAAERRIRRDVAAVEHIEVRLRTAGTRSHALSGANGR